MATKSAPKLADIHSSARSLGIKPVDIVRAIPVPDKAKHPKRHYAALGRRGGLATTPAKAAAVRENGKLGGRPRIKKAAAEK